MVLGTAGHIDHGKTSLVRALTGIETDRHPEEKRRGITIELGFASWKVGKDIEASIVDVPGHDSLVRTMIAGAGGIDLVLMAISAEDGVMPQTREHLNVCGLLGVRAGIVALTKVDRLDDPEDIEMAIEDVRDCLAGTVFEDAPIMPCSAHTGEGLDEIRAAVLTRLRGLPGRDRKGPVRFPIDRAFTMKGHGTVVTGTLHSGEIDIKREPELLHLAPNREDEGLPRRIRSLQVRGESVTRARAGSRVAANIAGVEREAFSRGDLLVTPGGALRSTVFHGLVSLLDWTRTPLHTGRGVQVCAGTAFANATVDLLAIEPEVGGALIPDESGTLAPGATGLVRLRLEQPLIVWSGQRFVLRAYEDPDAISHGLTIGGGEIVDPLPSSGRAQRSRWVRVANDLRGEDESLRALAAIVDAGEACINRATLEARAGLNQAETGLAPLLRKPAKVIALSESSWVSADLLPSLRRQVLALADAYHRDHPLRAGISSAELEGRLPGRCSPQLARRVITDAIESGELRRADAEGRLARPGQGKLDPENLPPELGRVLAMYEQGDLAPPTIKDLQLELAMEAKAVLELVSSLHRAELLVRVSNDLSYHAPAHARLLSGVREHLEQSGEFDVQALKAMTGLSRKFAVPLMEHFDRLGITIRRGDKRVPGPKAGI
jgi:selenocysteine-specific elongation factor